MTEKLVYIKNLLYLCSVKIKGLTTPQTQTPKTSITMQYTKEESLRNFQFWSGAADRVKDLTNEDLDTIEAALEDSFGDRTPSETEINDILWFDSDWIAEILGYEDWDDLIVKRS